MIIAGPIFATVAAFIHIYIFCLESIAQGSKRTQTAFDTNSVREVRMTKFMAFSQGLYNLFLVLLTIVEIAMRAAGSSAVGLTLAFAGATSMLATVVVLFITSTPHRTTVLKQSAFPLLAVGSLGLGLVLQASARYSSRMGIFAHRRP